MDVIRDCVVVGGGAAGLSAALVLGRAQRRTLLIDAGRPSNLPAHGIGGLLGHDHRPPADLYGIGRSEVLAYPSVQIRTCEVVAGKRTGAHFVLELVDGTREMTRRVLLATGMEYQRPGLPGLEDLWGDSVFHCPFCHGWEMRDRPLAVLDPAGAGPQRPLLLRGWSDDVVLLTNGPAQLTVPERERLAVARIPVDERRVENLIARDGQLEAIAFAGGGRLARAGLLLGVRLRQRSPLAGRLGVPAGDPTPLALDPIAVDPLQRTGVPGVFAAGDVTGGAPSVASAIAAGSLAAASVVHSLIEDDEGAGD